MQNGLGWLAGEVPDGDLTWVHDITPVTIDVHADPALSGYEPLEAHWRDPVLAAMGFGPGMDGVDEYVAELESSLGVARAYVAFFTKYRLGGYAYAAIGGPRLVMNYDLDGWKLENMDQIFAHETCHIFGAPDEYAAVNCNCGGSWGTSGGPNSNCITCAADGGVPCIMRDNEKALCAATFGHLGW